MGGDLRVNALIEIFFIFIFSLVFIFMFYVVLIAFVGKDHYYCPSHDSDSRYNYKKIIHAC